MFFYELDETAERETFDKAGLIDDPYVTQEQGIQSVDWQDWPRVEYPDVYNYLTHTPSVYTGESLRALKVITLVYKWPGFKHVGSTNHVYTICQTRYCFC